MSPPLLLKVPARMPSVLKGALLPACLAVLAFVAAGLFPVGNSDTYGHLAQGRQIFELGEVPQLDYFSFWKAEPQPWHNYEWGSDVIFWLLYSLGGVTLLLALKLLVLAALAVLLVQIAVQRTTRNPALAAWLTTLLLICWIPVVRVRLTVRPHLFGYVFAAVLLVGLPHVLNSTPNARARRHAWSWTGALIVAHLVWVNLHGSHLLGLVITTLHLMACANAPSARTRLAVLLLGQMAVSTISPFGPAILWDAVAHVIRPEFRQTVSEWSAWSSAYSYWYIASVVVAGALLAIVAVPLWRTGRLGKASLMTCALLGLMSVRSLRFQALFLLLTSPMIAAVLAERVQEHWRAFLRRSIPAAVFVAALGAVPAAASLPPYFPFGAGASEAWLPAGSGRWLGTHMPKAKVLAAIDDAWYLMFAAPEARFLADGRVPFYGAQHIQTVARAFESPAVLNRLLRKYPVDAVVVRFAARGQQSAIDALLQHPDWELVWIENLHALFVKNALDRQAPSSEPPLEQLIPQYAAHTVLALPAQDVGKLKAELARLQADANSDEFVNWTRGLLLLKPLAREAAQAGFSAPETSVDKANAARAARLLADVADRLDFVPVVQAYAALAALAACELQNAQHYIERARVEGDNREALLTEMEVSLRAGQHELVRQRLAQAQAIPQAQADPWLQAIGDDLKAGVRCQWR